MMNKNWKRKILIAMVAMALVMQQVGASNVVSAKENVEYAEQEMEIKEASRDYDDSDGWDDDDSDDWDDDDSDGWDDDDSDDADDDGGEEGWIEPSMAVSSLTLKAGKTSKIAIDGDWEEVVWKSSKNSVVKVDGNGKVTGVKAGKATITAIVCYYRDTDEWVDVEDEDESGDYDYEADEDSGDEDSELAVKVLKCTVKVTATPLKISAKKVNLKVGKSKVLKVTGATGKVSWKTNNKRVAKVVNGKVTALKPGKAKITAKVGKKTLTCKVVVKKK